METGETETEFQIKTNGECSSFHKTCACVALRSKPARHGNCVGCDKSAAVVQSYRNVSELKIMRKKGKVAVSSRHGRFVDL